MKLYYRDLQLTKMHLVEMMSEENCIMFARKIMQKLSAVSDPDRSL